jgi:site-specific recombinase
MVGAITFISLAILAVGVTALISWLRHDPKAAQAAKVRPVDDVAPDSPEAAVKVAREFCDLMVRRNFAEAGLITTGNAAQLVRQELEARMA